MSKEILISDPDKMVHEEFERIFKAADYHLLFTSNDEEALLRVRLFKPDLIIGGKDLCQTVRSEQETKDIPFILLPGMFEDLLESELKHLGADGLISRPISGEEVLDLTNHLIGSPPEDTGRKAFSEGNLDWRSISDIGKEGIETRMALSLDGFSNSDEEEEIIELLDVVEEPESKMSIDDFAIHQKAELNGEIVPIESWEKEAVEGETMMTEELSLEGEGAVVEASVPPETELFEKIELEELLQKVEKLQPSIETEWPAVQEEKITPPPQKTADRSSGLEEFEIALKGEVSTEPVQEELQPFFIEERKEEVPESTLSEKEATVELDLQELPEEEFPEFFLEELEEELEKIKEVELSVPEKAVEVEPETIQEEEISELLSEPLQSQEQVLEELVQLEALPPMEEKFAPLEETVVAEFKGEAILPPEQALEELIRLEEFPLREEERLAPKEEALASVTPPEEAMLPPEEALEEVVRLEALPSYEEAAPAAELMESEVSAPEVRETPTLASSEIPPPVMHLDRKIEEIIARGMQEMMQDFITKSIPEMTSHMIALTMERIETMVKELIPDLAEKAIREEIERLQKGDKD